MSEKYKQLLEKIKKDYPVTMEFLKDKASWEHMSIMAVLVGWGGHVKDVMKEEDKLRQKGTNDNAQ